MNRGRNPNNDTEMFATLQQDIDLQHYKTLLEHTEKGPHPTHEQLYAYSTDQLDDESEMHIERHIAFCRKCAQEVAAILRIEQETEQEFLDWAAEEPMPAEIQLHPPDKVSLPELMEHIKSDFWWQPEGAGEQQVAAATPKQEHEINVDDGSIKIECTWDRTYIWFSWRARIETDRELSVQFINPDTRKIWHEERLGRLRKGDKTFTSEVLGFDPTREKWAIVIA